MSVKENLDKAIEDLDKLRAEASSLYDFQITALRDKKRRHSQTAVDRVKYLKTVAAKTYPPFKCIRESGRCFNNECGISYYQAESMSIYGFHYVWLLERRGCDGSRVGWCLSGPDLNSRFGNCDMSLEQAIEAAYKIMRENGLTILDNEV